MLKRVEFARWKEVLPESLVFFNLYFLIIFNNILFSIIYIILIYYMLSILFALCYFKMLTNLQMLTYLAAS
jgi:hypothetical protein